jgi:CIC family chloride channel protein
MHLDMTTALPLATLAMIFALKGTAAAVSLGSGFRGGLFFASLFMGALLGKMLALGIGMAWPAVAPDPLVAAVICMSGLAVAVVGGPLTMGFMALEATGDYVITGTALAAAVVASLTVRELFGYSFSTWRMHLRGETIRGAHDVGWIRSLTVGKLMQRGPATVPADMAIAEFRKRFPIGAMNIAVVVDGNGAYAGIAWVQDAYATDGALAQAARVGDIVKDRDNALTSGMNVQQALRVFDATTSEALAVVDKEGKVLGLLSEAFALRHYAEALDQARRNLSGERDPSIPPPSRARVSS